MKYLAAYCLAALSGNVPTVNDVESILKSIGADIDKAQIAKIIAALDNKKIDQVIAGGMIKLEKMFAKDEVKVEKVNKPEVVIDISEKVEEEEDLGLGFALFDNEDEDNDVNGNEMFSMFNEDD